MFDRVTGDISTSSNYDDRHSSKEPVSVQVQSDEVETTTEECSEESEKARLNEVISYEEIDRALATHIKRSIDKIHEISAILQGTRCRAAFPESAADSEMTIC